MSRAVSTPTSCACRSPSCATLWPRLITGPLAALGLWLGAALLLHAAHLARGAAGRGAEERDARAHPSDWPDGQGSR